MDKIIYVDGVEEVRKTNQHLGKGLGTGITRYGFIGDGSEANVFDANRNNKFFEGTLDEVRIYQRVLTPDEILELYQEVP